MPQNKSEAKLVRLDHWCHVAKTTVADGRDLDLLSSGPDRFGAASKAVAAAVPDHYVSAERIAGEPSISLEAKMATAMAFAYMARSGAFLMVEGDSIASRPISH
jgi:hypothetical protein